MWIRTCQECGHKQEDFNPNAKRMLQASIQAYEARRCKECKSSSLDWGKEKLSEPDSTWSE